METKINIGDITEISSQITGYNEWIKATIIDIENNPFRGVVVSVKDNMDNIFGQIKNILESQREYRKYNNLNI